MSTDVETILLRSPLERKAALPLHEQLRSSLEMAIISGEIQDGAPLPSVRRLAQRLAIAPTTVVRVYRDLLDSQLIEVVPKRGYFVTTGLTLDADGPGIQAARRVIDDAIDRVAEHGVGLPAFLQLVVEQVRQRQQAPRRVAVVGQRDAALPERVAWVSDALEDLPVEVVSLSFEELQARNNGRPPPDLAQVTWFLVPVGETRRAATLLGAHARRVVPMTRALRPDVQEFIASQPDHTRFGIVAGSDSLIGRVLSMVQRLHPLRVPPITTSIEHPAEIPRVLQAADALIVGSLAHPYMQDRLPRGKPSIELTYIPDDRTLRRLRSLITAD